jgi:hypothetical protein
MFQRNLDFDVSPLSIFVKALILDFVSSVWIVQNIPGETLCLFLA